MRYEDLITVQNEINRFQERLSEMRKRANKDEYAFQGCKESGTLKRSAMDLKNELIKLTK
jgi:predicted  nucleic acid-binding Zn-ribbon protein